jgi:hypothetical protein
MSSRTFRRTAAALLVATFVSLTAASPAHAFGSVRRSFDGPARTEPRSPFVVFLLRIFDLAGGAMDPNGGS